MSLEVLVRQACTKCHGHKELYKLDETEYPVDSTYIAVSGKNLSRMIRVMCSECDGVGHTMYWARMTCAHFEIVEKAEDF